MRVGGCFDMVIGRRKGMLIPLMGLIKNHLLFDSHYNYYHIRRKLLRTTENNMHPGRGKIYIHIKL